ncbi:DNA-processing protein DprA [Caldibacillus lycopersici]|uniref:DNA-processing protein DprA n=1 Tax=Perspicuibacillus lycopersici TaxID=1325689 RepID=A0AAE3LLN4_9BACI|nr:DNA-processing protein DprA [Perspicuibacillus lycopersici]MCU9612116.1 DNA-processing protein DprA [Perspicuibacillus lycopersici]
MNNESVRERLIHLLHCQGIGWKTLYKMMKKDPTLLSVYSYSLQELQHYFQIPSNKIHSFFQDLHYLNPATILAAYKKQNIEIVTIIDDTYPLLLKNTFQPPWVLYCKGNRSLLAEKEKLAVVGTRNPTPYGIKVTREIVAELAKKQIVIVSGLAKGIDFEAHVQAMQSQGKTIAVLGGGFFHIYPKEHEPLARKLEQNHLIISEYPPHIYPQRHHFPERNRIISGLSFGTLVIEAKHRSGSLITADFALNEGREVFAIPGPITSSTSNGTNELIKAGAKLVTCGEDIITEIPSYL